MRNKLAHFLTVLGEYLLVAVIAMFILEALGQSVF